MLQLLEVFHYCVQRYHVISVVVAQALPTVYLRHQFAPVVPGGEIREVLHYQCKSHLTFGFNEWLLVLLVDLFQGFAFNAAPECMLLQKRLNDPQLIIPTMKIALILLQHLVAKKQLILQDIRIHLDFRQFLFKLQSLL